MKLSVALTLTANVAFQRWLCQLSVICARDIFDLLWSCCLSRLSHKEKVWKGKGGQISCTANLIRRVAMKAVRRS